MYLVGVLYKISFSPLPPPQILFIWEFLSLGIMNPGMCEKELGGIS